MIEVEKKFNPNPEQLQQMLEGAEFLGEKVVSDTYYELPGNILFKKGLRFRRRDGVLELKVLAKDYFSSFAARSDELTEPPEILTALGFDPNDDLEQVVNNQMEVFSSITTTRKKYRKGDFVFDLDQTSFGYDVCEVEIMVENESQVAEAEKKIMELAQSVGLSLERLPGKMYEYIRRVRPELFEEFFGKKSGELKGPKIK